jgi:hypothetical protein
MGFKQMREVLFAIFEDGRSNQMNFLFFEDIYQLHLLLNGKEELVNLPFLPLTSV